MDVSPEMVQRVQTGTTISGNTPHRPNMEAKAGFFYFREIFGMFTSVLTIGTTAPIIVFMYLENPTILNDLETCKYRDKDSWNHDSISYLSHVMVNDSRHIEVVKIVLMFITLKKA